MKGLELYASIIALAGVLFTARAKVVGWPLGIAGATLFVILCFESMLYAEAILQVLYVFMGIFGWYEWTRAGNSGDKTSSRMPLKTWTWSVVVWLALSTICGILLDHFSPTDVPYPDAFLAVAGVVITWQMAEKYLENWLNWIVVDTASGFLFLYKELYYASALYFIFTILAAYGYLKWKNELQSA